MLQKLLLLLLLLLIIIIIIIIIIMTQKIYVHQMGYLLWHKTKPVPHMRVFSICQVLWSDIQRIHNCKNYFWYYELSKYQTSRVYRLLLRYSVSNYLCYVESAWQTIKILNFTQMVFKHLWKFKAALDFEFPNSL